MARPSNAKKIRASLRELALTYPGAHEDFPWGESVIKVQGKVFVFLGVEKEPGASFCVKLPHSGDIALSLPFFKPAGYGLGKSGWVQAKLADDAALPPDLLSEWLEESYRAVAPKRLAAMLKRAEAVPAIATKAPAKAKMTAKTKSVAKPEMVAKATIAAKPKVATTVKSRA